ncbi:MAG: nucleoside kinase [Prolixibacteraceae bacterium]|jgi:uridine kinase|nr:nucleoside kinase [Prolixibacteraceae bacterium]MBT6764646.1 nucleoside kinase [Prolixibacteraceae bacterium]MBT6999457.1 nucleoside kinase [Prolixibacteraceae bacterium]MBT7394778.1 nucleoside kinase [Prolixibacteraceae bacterium]
MKQVEIYCKSTQSTHSYPLGTSLLEISKDLNIQMKNTVCGAIVNHQVKELSFCLVKPKRVEFFDISHPDGIRMYIRSLIFVFYAAIKEALPHVTLQIQHGISNGYYCELSGLEREISDSDIFAIKQEMKLLIEQKIPFIKKELLTDEIVDLLMKQGLEEKARLFEQQGNLYAQLYFLNDLGNFFYGHLLPSTDYLSNFDLVKYFDGLLLQIPKRKKIQKLRKIVKLNKLFGIYKEHKNWAEILNVSTIGNLNDFTLQKRSGDIIKISEALHEKKIAEIANKIHLRNGDVKVVLVAGPSASGKTTFSKRLGVQLAVNGLRPFQISLDNYFVDREKTPRDEFGEYDYEALEAIDIEFFNQQLLELFEGKEVQIPRFDFQLGCRFQNGKKLKLLPGDILIVEGIHGMNPNLIPKIDEKNTFKIFISALTQISFDEHNYISTADNRLIRRMIRDSKYRGYPASETIKRWPSVRRGEEKNIFPFQENADVMFNSATLYELAVLKKYADPILKQVSENQEEYVESTRLLEFLSYFKPINDEEIPPTSLLREFLGGSSFAY